MPNDVKELLGRQPFRPFVIHLTNGDVIAVERSESLSLSPKGDRLNVFTDDGRFHLVNMAEIAELKVACPK